MGIKVKAVRNGDVRLLTSEQIEFSVLEQRIAEAFNLSPSNFQLFWTDEDGDKITIANENDWAEAVGNHADKKTIKVLIDEKATESASNPTKVTPIQVTYMPQSKAEELQSKAEELEKEEKPAVERKPTAPKKSTTPIDTTPKKKEPETKPFEATSEEEEEKEEDTNPLAEVFSEIIDNISTFLNSQGLEKSSNKQFPEHLQSMIHSGMFPMPLVHVFTNIQEQQPRRCPTQCPRTLRGHNQSEKKPEAVAERERERPSTPVCKPGEYLPNAPLAPGAFGEGVVQLQHALIHLGLMAPGAIRWRAGVYAWNTANAIASLHNEDEDDEADRGKYTEKIRSRLLKLLTPQDQQQPKQQQQEDKLIKQEEKQQKKIAKESSVPVEPKKNIVYPDILEEQDNTGEHVYAEMSHDAPILRRATSDEQNDDNPPQVDEENVYVQDPPAEPTSQPSKDRVRELALKWSDQLQALLLMGFNNDHKVLLDTIEKHHGAMPFVVADLLSA